MMISGLHFFDCSSRVSFQFLKSLGFLTSPHAGYLTCIPKALEADLS
jgi:hypothetical protein